MQSFVFIVGLFGAALLVIDLWMNKADRDQIALRLVAFWLLLSRRSLFDIVRTALIPFIRAVLFIFGRPFGFRFILIFFLANAFAFSSVYFMTHVDPPGSVHFSSLSIHLSLRFLELFGSALNEDSLPSFYYALFYPTDRFLSYHYLVIEQFLVTAVCWGSFYIGFLLSPCSFFVTIVLLTRFCKKGHRYLILIDLLVALLFSIASAFLAIENLHEFAEGFIKSSYPIRSDVLNVLVYTQLSLLINEIYALDGPFVGKLTIDGVVFYKSDISLIDGLNICVNLVVDTLFNSVSLLAGRASDVSFAAACRSWLLFFVSFPTIAYTILVAWCILIGRSRLVRNLMLIMTEYVATRERGVLSVIGGSALMLASTFMWLF